MKKGRKTIKEATHMLMTKFDILEKKTGVSYLLNQNIRFLQ
jgi:hypothetical protein